MGQIGKDGASIVIEGDGVELRTAEIGDMTAAFVTVPKGTDFGPALKGLPGDACPCPHWGYMVKGRLKIGTPDGEEILEAGNVFYLAPGHAPEALEDSEWIDFSPTEELNEVLDHIRGVKNT
ncbi:MAG: hypothetical protein ABR575_07610 [Actinomycetota bacterium]